MKYDMIFNYEIKQDKIEVVCPSCGQKCQITDELCPNCNFCITDWKILTLAYYKYYNDAIDKTNSKNYILALISISKFLAFEPENENANKLYIYLLFKNGFLKEYQDELDIFEEKFKRNQWIMEIETNGIESYKIPEKIEINNLVDKNAFAELKKEYLYEKTQSNKNIVEFILEFYDLIRRLKKQNSSKLIIDFYEEEFKKFISKREISLYDNNGKNINELSNEELGLLDVVSQVINLKEKDGTIITISPLVKIRSSIYCKEKVICVFNSKGKKQQ